MKKLVAFACIVLFTTSAYAFNMAAQKIDKNMETALQTALNDGYEKAIQENAEDIPPSVLITSKIRYFARNANHPEWSEYTTVEEMMRIVKMMDKEEVHISPEKFTEIIRQHRNGGRPLESTCAATFISNKWLLTHKNCVETDIYGSRDLLEEGMPDSPWFSGKRLMALTFTIKYPSKKARTFYVSFPYSDGEIGYASINGTDLVLINMENIRIDKTNKTLSSEIGGDNILYKRIALSGFSALGGRLDLFFLEKARFFTPNYPNAKFILSNIFNVSYTIKNKSRIDVQKFYPGEPIYFRNKANNRIIMFGINNSNDINKELYIPMDKTLANRINKIINKHR
ncbi:MAG: hypothetical protein LBM71_01505 [Elusimicrobiota bacterium]|jgi:hypothetical protein|nr:hypothetical protein [Elusimicrobiota bacterium]